jgi:hypothetical protein
MTTNQRLAKLIADKTFDLLAQSAARSILKGDVERAAFEAIAIAEADAASGGLIETIRAADSGKGLREAAGELLKELDRIGLRSNPGVPIDLSTAIKGLESALLAELLR